MSWFEIPKSFVAHTDAKAEEVDENFDAVEVALNSLLQAARVSASSTLTLASGAQDVPGASAAVNPSVPSILFAVVTIDGEGIGTCALNIDGADQAPNFSLGGAKTQAIVSKLSAGSHTVKLRASGGLGTVGKAHTGFSYILFPNPEP